MDSVKVIKPQDIGTERFWGIEALRLISMLFVVIFHITIWNDVESVQGAAFLTALGGIGVNTFAVITGFVCYTPSEKQLKLTKIINLWATVFTYSVGIMLVGKALTPSLVSNRALAMSFLPVTSSHWWYFSSYMALCFLRPLLCTMVRNLSLSRRYIYIYIAVFSVYTTVAGLLHDPFNLMWGYSTLWLSVMFVVGALLKKYDVASKITAKKAVGLLAAAYLMVGIGATGIEMLSGWLLGRSIGGKLFTDYTSPFMILCSVLLVLLSARMKLPKQLKRIVAFFAPAAFGVYIIHFHPYIAENLLKGKLLWVNRGENIVSFILPVLVAIFVWLICLVLERSRIAFVGLIKHSIKILKARK